MKIEREFVDGKGARFRAVMTISEGALLERALANMAQKARSRPRQQVSALGGAVHVIVHPIKDAAVQR